MKKALLMGLSLVMVAAIAIFGTMAYFTDTDGAVNVMTVGNVQIELVEQQRTFDTSTASGSTVTTTTGLEDFEQNKELMPIVGSAQGEKDQYGMPIAKNYVDKIVRVENTGDNDAYVRVIIAVPAALEESTTAAGKNALHWNLGNRFDENGTGAYNSGDWKVAGNPYFADFGNGVASNTATATINGIEYNLYTYTRQNALASDELTAAVITGFYLDDGVDFDGTNYTLDGQVINYDLSKGVIIPVMAQAVQAAGFDTAEAAFTASKLPTNPWADGVKLPVVVTNDAELKSAIDEGAEEIILESGNYGVIDVTVNRNLTLSAAANADVKIAGIDGQSNNNSTNVTIKGVTIDNSLKTEGWYIGTAQNIKPCVGVWGGNYTFENCTFYVTGESKAETGVMSWWTTNKGVMNFTNCTFNGGNNSARGMQIYGNYDLNVTNCTFNTAKDYSIKYVGSEGCVATFKNNNVNATENFVQTGSAPYAGENYTLVFEGNTLASDIKHVYVDNAEGQTITINGEVKAATAGAIY